MRPAVTKIEWFARTPDKMLADIEAAYPGARIAMLADERRPRRRSHVRLTLDQLCINRFETVGSEISANKMEMFNLGFVTQGKVLVRSGRREATTLPFSAGTTMLPGQPFAMRVQPSTFAYAVDFTTAELQARAEQLLGKRVAMDHCVASVDLHRGAGAAWVRNVLGLFHEIQFLHDAGLSELAAVSFGELLSNLAIAAAFPELEEARMPVHESASLSRVDRAREYMSAFAHEPISINKLAVDLGVTVRALQAGFQKQLGCSPLQFLLQRRLLLARTRLLAPGPGETVTSIALSCGFANLGKFGIRYRAAYGELPSRTLKRARSLS